LKDQGKKGTKDSERKKNTARSPKTGRFRGGIRKKEVSEVAGGTS